MNKEPRYAPWPFGIETARHELDVDLIEAHAVDIVGRALATKRLVIFAGAGLTMAYGRITWSQLLDLMYEHLLGSGQESDDRVAEDPLYARKVEAAKHMGNTLWPQGFKDFKDGKGDYVIAAQLFADVLIDRQNGASSELTSPAASEIAPLHKWVASHLRNHYGRLDQFLDRSSKGDAQHPDPLPSQRRGSRPDTIVFIDFVLDVVTGQADEAALQSKYEAVYLPFQSATGSPLDILIHDYGARRFLTTNYDREIERAFTAFDFPSLEVRAQREVNAHGTWHRSFSLREDSTAEAVCFAVEGARRHAAVLHVHGVCDQPGMIVTEADYQRLYLQEHDRHDLLENAARSNFGANPILFVGSNVEEDDIMRPLRQFMTGTPHHRDRMAVALLPATGGKDKASLQKLKLYLRFGVHAIHYGYGFAAEAQGEASAKVCVLQELDKVFRRLLDFCEMLETQATTGPTWQRSHEDAEYFVTADGYLYLREAARGRLTLRALASTAERDGRLEMPVPGCDAYDLKTVQWQALQAGTLPPEGCEAFLEPYKKLVGSLHKAAAVAASLAFAQSPLDRQRPRGLRLAIEEIRSGVTTLFMCAALTRLKCVAVERAAEERRVASPFVRRIDDVTREGAAAGNKLLMRHTLISDQPGYEGWFIKAGKLREPPDQFVRILQQIERYPRFRENQHRRVIVVSAARGAGKGSLFDSLREVERRRQLCQALAPHGAEAGALERTICFHINLSFSDEIGAILSYISRSLLKMLSGPLQELPPEQRPVSQDQMELIALALESLMLNTHHFRCLLILGNASVLFDERGFPKNGQIRRFFQLFRSPTYRKARLDALLFCSEAQLPAVFRSDYLRRRRRATDAGTSTPPVFHGAEVLHTGSAPEPSLHIDVPEMPALTAAALSLDEVLSSSLLRMQQRRQRLLNQQTTDKTSELLIGLRPLRAEQLWENFFAESGGRNVEVDSRVLLEIYRATGANRMAMTLIFAYVRLGAEAAIVNELGEIARELRVCTPDIAVEKTAMLVIDRWFQRHLRGESVPWPGPAEDLPRRSRTVTLSVAHWDVVTEVMWTLSVISQPVDISVLCESTSIRAALQSLRLAEWRNDPPPDDEKLLSVTVELLVHWCLVFRIGNRSDLSPGRWRYSLHRHIQRHYLRISGGHNVETTRWDQFTTTMYASQPDELPTISAHLQNKLVGLVKKWSRYPEPYQPLVSDEAPLADVQAERECLRAAYSLIRSSFSMGVLARSVDTSPQTVDCGAMERYRRMVRWITLRARKLGERPLAPGEKKSDSAVFYPGELAWLYNECGVIALAQGKLDQAEEYLTMAERAVREIENDNSGSLHVRVRLQTALVLIERGQSSPARAILLPISTRRSGHPVLPNLAKFYLGLIEHLGGNYKLAESLYEEAARGLRLFGRSRALAFVLQSRADVHFTLYPHDLNKALSMADEAISLAQRGGHADVAVLSTLSRARLCIEAGLLTGLFDQLDLAQRYANRMDMPRIACRVHELRARLLHRQGETVLSAKEASTSLEIAALYDLKLMKVRALLTLANIYCDRGEQAGAATLAEAGREMAGASDYFSCVRGFDDLSMRLIAGKRPTLGGPTGSAGLRP